MSESKTTTEKFCTHTHVYWAGIASTCARCGAKQETRFQREDRRKKQEKILSFDGHYFGPFSSDEEANKWRDKTYGRSQSLDEGEVHDLENPT